MPLPTEQPALAALAALAERARAVAGGDRTWADLSFLPALELLVASCGATAALDARGRRVLDSVVVRHLANRLLLEAQQAARPGVARPLAAPAVVVTGLPRTGTTLLHHLLALDPAARALRLWEALRPVPPGAGPSEAELVGQAETWLARLYDLVPGFRAIHGATAGGPEECDTLLQNDFASQHFEDMFDAAAYSEWLATAPLRGEYRSYARQLNGLWRPDDEGRTWVLKSPSHLGHLDALLEACPEAVVVQCHRHPFEAVPSYASLVLCLRRAYSDAASAGVVGGQALRRCRTALDRALDVRHQAPDRFVDVSYGDLVRRPVPTVAALYERLGRPFPAEMAPAVEKWVARHPQHEHGVHRYAMDDFDLTEPRVAEACARYLDEWSPLLC